MNPVAEEILSNYVTINPVAKDILMHYGMPRRSGRYPWGSGDDPYQHGSGDFLSRVEALKKSGWTETAENIKKEFGEGVTLNDYRNEKSWCNYERRLRQVETAKRLRDKEGLNNTEIGRRMGINESSVRSLLNPDSESRMKAAANTADFLKKQVDEKGMIDVGADVEKELNVTRTMLDTALYKLQGEGYNIYTGGIPQPTNPGQQTNQKVLAKPDVPYKDIYDFDKVHTINEYISRDGGDTYEKKFHYPESLDSKRLKIRYMEDGGIDKDGIIELRRGCDDLSLGESRYAQVRIMVDGKKYLKGMAVYSDDMPDGVDVIFNTNKSKKVAKLDVLKDIKDDPDNPFGSLIKDADQGGQYWYTDSKGKRKLGLINKRSDEGDWEDWKDALPSQFLGKQSRSLAKQQLKLARIDKQAEYDDIMSINNPTIKRHMLGKFADSCDAAAVDLKAAALPGQKYHVIIPITSMKDTEIYAPKYDNGTKLALIRYPHGGTFEIPIVTVNNKHPVAKKLLGKDITDAVGINSRVAERLSGADFDGDTVMCIPTHDPAGKVKIRSKNELEGLKGFDPKVEYGGVAKTGTDGKTRYYRNGAEYPIMKRTDLEMGKISNLITDMTLAGADDKELARAVRHSMVVIDAEKHKLDYKQSAIDNNIAELRKEYQRHVDSKGKVRYGGASTILSRSSGEYDVDKREGSPSVNVKGKPWYDPNRPEGALIYKTARPEKLYRPDYTTNKKTGLREIKTTDGKTIAYNPKDPKQRADYTPIKKVDPDTGAVKFTNKAGTLQYKSKKVTQKSTKMAETDDAYSLVSEAKHPMEIIYADHANAMKSMANRARISMMNTGRLQFSSSAKSTYRKEVDSLMSKLNDAKLNSIKERAVLRKANAEIKAKRDADPDMKTKDVKKISQQAVSKYREEVGSISRKKRNIEISDREWEAIQAGAISDAKLVEILNNTDIDKLRERATPKVRTTLTSSQISRIKSLSANYTIAEIAKKMGKSPSTISNYLKGVN
jgi:DNA-binding CsgD family transcriptional regulator